MASGTQKAKRVNKRKKTMSGKNRKRAIRSATKLAADAKIDVL